RAGPFVLTQSQTTGTSRTRKRTGKQKPGKHKAELTTVPALTRPNQILLTASTPKHLPALTSHLSRYASGFMAGTICAALLPPLSAPVGPVNRRWVFWEPTQRELRATRSASHQPSGCGSGTTTPKTGGSKST